MQTQNYFFIFQSLDWIIIYLWGFFNLEYMEIFSWSTIEYWIGNVVWQFLSYSCIEWFSCMNF